MQGVRSDCTLRCGRCGVSAADRPDWGRYEKNGILKPFCPDCYASGRVKQTSGKHRCKRCGALAINRPDWGRYENSGRLKVLCPECDAQQRVRREEQHRRNALAAAAGYRRGWTSTPDYHRMQRERAAVEKGRVLKPYVPQAERERIGRMVDADAHADSIRARWVRAWLAPLRSLHQEMLRGDPEYRAQNAYRYREHYRHHRDGEIARVAAYKRAHADRNLEWTVTRKEREAVQSDGTATPEAIVLLKQQATHCAYCGGVLAEKQTDHMNPIVLGGEHSLRNIVVVCPSCNGRKARLTYQEWIERVEPEHRERVRAVYRERYGDPVQVVRHSETLGPRLAIFGGAFRDCTI